MSESQFFDLVARVDTILSTRDITTAIPELRGLLQNGTLHSYFFDNLKDVDWLHPLADAGFFTNPPPVKSGPDKGTLEFPPWPESHYLARMAVQAPEAVLKVITQLPDTDNIRVHEDLADAALAMPAEMAAKWAEKETRWVEQQKRIAFRLPEKLGALVVHLAKGGRIEAALRLARSLLAVLLGPRETDKTDEEETYRLPPELRARFDTWHYEQILKKHVPDLVATAEEKALALLCDLLDSAVCLSRSHAEDEGPEDYSYIWRPAIEDHEQNHPHGLKDLLVSAVRDAAEQIARADPSRVPALVEKLERCPWRVFQRIALHLLRVFPDAAPALVADRLTDRARFDEPDFLHEYVLLARERFAHLSPDDQAKILNWIAAGPDLEQFKVGHEKWTGRRPTDEEIEQHTKYWQLRHLSPLRDALPAEWKRHYDEWVAELGEPKHPEFDSYISSGSWGPASPKSVDELRTMDIEEIVAFLRDWQSPKNFTGPSPEGLGQELKALVASEPERFAGDATRFQGLDPTYVRAFLSGLRDVANQKRAFPWSPVLHLCRGVMEQPREIPGRKSEYADLDPGWVWTRQAIANLLSDGFGAEAGPAEIPFELRSLTWDVLRPLTDDPDPTPEHEARYGGSNMDPLTRSLNTTRGKAMHAVVGYALWVRRHIEKAPNGKERIARGFDEMPEVQEVLDAHLDLVRDPALAIRAIYGQWFPWLVLLDHEWAIANVSRIFPSDELLRDWRDAAWESYIIYCAPYDSGFDVLRDEYGRAVERIGAPDRKVATRLANPEERLAEHLMVFYWRGKLTLDEPDSLLARFYANASDALRGHAFEFLGRSLRGVTGTTPTEVIDKLKTLWERRLAFAQADTSPASHTIELAAFGWWFASAKFDDMWVMTQLTEVLRLVGKAEPDHMVVECLAELAVRMPLQTAKCLRLVIEGDKEGWGILGWREHARTILATAIQSSDLEARQAAVNLVHRLGARGHLEFRDLLPKVPSS